MSFHIDKKQVNLSWSTIQEMITILSYMVEPLKPKKIVAIARGGLIPARMLSTRLGDIPIYTITASAYEGTRRTLQKPIVIDGWKPEYNTSDTLVVDDIMDSGDTYAKLLDQQVGALFTMATLIKKRDCRFINHHTFVGQVSQDVWVNFPWE